MVFIKDFRLMQVKSIAEPVSSVDSKKDKTKILKTNGSLMKVESIAYRAYPGSEFVEANTLAKWKNWSQMKLTLAKVLARK